MKDYINRLARGVFDYEPAVIYLPENHIEQEIDLQSGYSGSFIISSLDKRQVRGAVYSANPRVIADDPVFNGTECVIHYHVVTKGLECGSQIDGRIDIVSNGGEQSFYYSFKIKDKYITSSMGKINNLFHFANLVMKEPEEAGKIFIKPDFSDILIRDDYRLKNTYSLVSHGTNLYSNMEEFLISTRKKNSIVFGVSAMEKTYADVSEDIRDSVIIIRNTWGYTDITVTSDNECIVPLEKKIDSDMFAGNRYELFYTVDYEKCHAGNNYAVISLDSVAQHIDINITITCHTEKDENKAAVNKEIYLLIKSYIAFRLGRQNMQIWLRDSLASAQKLRSIDSSSPLFELLHAQFLLAGRKREDAGWLIEHAGKVIKRGEEAWLTAYYYYLSCLLRQDKSYTKEVLEQVKLLYEQHNDEWRIKWVILYLDEEYEKNKTMKLAAIKEQYYRGCISPVMYIEALAAFNEQPVLLRVFDEFELQVLNFGLKQQNISDRLLEHIAQLTAIKKSPSQYFVRFLKNLYMYKENKEILTAICKTLIRNECNSGKDFIWYKRAVDSGVSLTNLYEYYLMTCDKTDMGLLNRQLLMYFSYNNTLDYHTKAYLYASVINNRYEDDISFEHYRRQMRSFALDQIMKERINDNLFIIYKEIVDRTMVTPETAKELMGILFTRRVTCKCSKVCGVYIKHKEFDEPQYYKLTNGKAFVRIYTEDAVIAFDDMYGNIYTQSVAYTVEKLFDEYEYIKKLMHIIPDYIWMRLYLREHAGRYELSQEERIDNLKVLMQEESISAHIRMLCMSDIIQYYYSDYDGYNLAEEYIDVNPQILSSKLRNMAVDTYMVNGCFDKAYDIVKEYGFEGCNPKRMLRLCRYLIEEKGLEYDKTLCDMCSSVFAGGKYDVSVIKYLEKYMTGNTKQLISLWQTAGGFEIERRELSERLLVMMMFVHAYNGSFESIFEDYYNSGASLRVVEAYIGYNAYNYFVKDMVTGDDVFKVIRHMLLNGQEVTDIAKIALLSYFSDRELEEDDIQLAQRIMDELCAKGIIFSFYRKFSGRIKVPFNVRCMTIAEYAASPDTTVMIHYIHTGADGNGQYIVEQMKMMYDAVFVKQFLLFYGESVQYYITEEKNGQIKHTESHTLVCEDIKADEAVGRYEMINDILSARALKDDITADRLITKYASDDYIATSLFKRL